MPNVIEITDFAAPELDVYARLTQAQLRSRLEPEKAFYCRKPQGDCPRTGRRVSTYLLLMERKQITGPASEVLARCGNAPVYTADRAMLAQLTGFELTRGVLCAMHRPLLSTVEEVCRNARRVAVLEGIVDSTNIGAIFRSAAALNMDAVLVTPSCCDPLCRRPCGSAWAPCSRCPGPRSAPPPPTGRSRACSSCTLSASRPPPWR